MNDNLLLVNTTDMSVYRFAKDNETVTELEQFGEAHRVKEITGCKERLEKYGATAKSHKIFDESYQRALKADYKVMTWKQFEQQEREFYLSGEPQETTSEEYNEMLNVLPPLHWCKINGVEMFCMCEFTTSTFTTQFAKVGNKYYTKTVDATDRSTWIYNYLK